METERASGSLRKAISILRGFSPNKLEFSVNEICQNSNIPKATAYRIMKTLAEGKFVERNVNTGKYRVGIEVFVLGSLYLHTLDIFRAAEPVIKSLTDLTDEAFYIGVLEESNMVVLMREESSQPLKFALPLGTIRPAYASAMGKALLSEFSNEEIDKIYPEEKLQQFTQYTTTSRTELKQALAQIRKSGISIDRGSYNIGGTGISKIIRNAHGQMVATMGATVPDSRINEDELEKLAGLVKRGANLISYRLGFRDSDTPVQDIEEIHDWWQRN